MHILAGVEAAFPFGKADGELNELKEYGILCGLRPTFYDCALWEDDCTQGWLENFGRAGKRPLHGEPPRSRRNTGDSSMESKRSCQPSGALRRLSYSGIKMRPEGVREVGGELARTLTLSGDSWTLLCGTDGPGWAIRG